MAASLTEPKSENMECRPDNKSLKSFIFGMKALPYYVGDLAKHVDNALPSGSLKIVPFVAPVSAGLKAAPYVMQLARVHRRSIE